VAKILHDSTDQTILVICFTNHALDQFLEDLMDIGIPQAAMVRLGSKSTDRTKPLQLREQIGVNLTASQWGQIDKLKARLVKHERRLADVFRRFLTTNIKKDQIMEYLEFLSDDMPYFHVFTVPQDEAGMTRVGKGGKELDAFYLLC
jgi:hypothetical protein